MSDSSSDRILEWLYGLVHERIKNHSLPEAFTARVLHEYLFSDPHDRLDARHTRRAFAEVLGGADFNVKKLGLYLSKLTREPVGPTGIQLTKGRGHNSRGTIRSVYRVSRTHQAIPRDLEFPPWACEVGKAVPSVEHTENKLARLAREQERAQVEADWLNDTDALRRERHNEQNYERQVEEQVANYRPDEPGERWLVWLKGRSAMFASVRNIVCGSFPIIERDGMTFATLAGGAGPYFPTEESAREASHRIQGMIHQFHGSAIVCQEGWTGTQAKAHRDGLRAATTKIEHAAKYPAAPPHVIGAPTYGGRIEPPTGAALNPLDFTTLSTDPRDW